MIEPSNTAVPKYYAEFRSKVESGEIKVCKEVLMEMARIEYLISSPDYYFDNDVVEGWILFCETELCLPNGGEFQLLYTFKLWGEQLLGWYEKVYYQEYVPYTTRPGGRMVDRYEFRRLIHKQYLIVGRGSAKTIYLECQHAYRLIMSGKTTDQLVCAPTEKQAGETFVPLATAIKNPRGPLFKWMTRGSKFSSNDHRKMKKLDVTAKEIRNLVTNGKMEFRPMDIAKVQGFRGDFATLDEWLSVRIKEDPIDAIGQGASKNKDYAIIAASSEGCVRDGPGDEIKMYLMNLLKGKTFDPHVSIWYYKLDDIEEVGQKEMWQKAMPTIGTTPLWSAVEDDVRLMQDQPSKRNDILAKRFGIATEGVSYYFEYEETLEQGYTDYSNQVCVVGGDFSQGDDFCTILFLFPTGSEFGVDSLSFVTRNNVNMLDSVLYNKYQEFIAEGSLIVMETPKLDMHAVFAMVCDYIGQKGYYPVGIGYDIYNSEAFISDWMNTFSLAEPTRVIQGARTESVPLGNIKTMAHFKQLHFHQKIVRFTMGNACVKEDTNGNKMLYKKNRQSKIDCVAAMIDAFVAYERFRDKFD